MEISLSTATDTTAQVIFEFGQDGVGVVKYGESATQFFGRWEGLRCSSRR